MKKSVSHHYPATTHFGKHTTSKKNSDRYVFILSIIFSFIFWLFIKLSDNYSQNYTMQIRYENVPADKQLTTLIDSTLTVNISANGYNILENKIKNKLHTVTINLKKCKLIKENHDIYAVKREGIKALLSEYLKIPETHIEIIKPELRFILEKTKKKKVAVKALTNLSFKSQYGLYNLTINPVFVVVYGPSSVLDTLSSLSTVLLKKVNLDKNLKESVTLYNPSPTMLHFVPKRVQVRLIVERYTESSLEIPINLSQMKIKLRTFPSTVKIYYRVAIKDYNSIHPNMFSIEPDIHHVDLKTVDKIKLKLTRKPDIVSQTRIDPPSVEFLIVK